MGLLEKLLPRFGEFRNSLENPMISLNDPRAWDELFGQNLSETGIRVTPKTGLGYPPLWRGINLIANTVKKLPLRVFSVAEENSISKAKAHPAYGLLRRKANPAMNAGTLKRTLTYHALFRGNGYAAIYRDGAGRPRELLLLSPTETAPAPLGGELWYVTRVAGMKRRFRAADILHIKGLSYDGLVGHDVISVFSDALGLGIAARKFGSKFFANGANAGGVLMLPRGMSEQAATRLRRDWKDFQEGIDNSFRTAVLEEGAKWVATTVNPEQSQLVALRQFEVREVANILGLPPHKLGDNSRLAYNSLEQENKASLEDAYDPWLVEWEEECDAKLLTDEEQEADTHYCQFDRRSLEQPDAAAQADIDGKDVNGGIRTLNEVRAARNLPPAPPEIGDRYRIPTIVTVGVPTPEAADGDGEPPPNETDPVTGGESAVPPPGNPPAPGGGGAQENSARLTAALDALLTDRIRRLEAIDATEIAKAGAKGTVTAAWLEAWQARAAARRSEALAPILAAQFAAEGREDDPAASARDEAAAYYAAEAARISREMPAA